MTHAYLIAAFLLTHLVGGLRTGSAGDPGNSWESWLTWLVPFVTLCAIVLGLVHRRVRLLEKTGLYLHAQRATRTAARARALAVVLHTLMLFTVGPLDLVRTITGDLVLVDELLATLPVMLVVVWSWWVIYPVERRLSEAMLMRRLDQGGTVETMPTRGQAVWLRVRQDMLFVVVPVCALLAMGEAVSGLSIAVSRADPAFRLQYPGEPPAPQWTNQLPESWRSAKLAAMLAAPAMLLGAGALLALFPLALRWIWGTVDLGPGPTRERIEQRLRSCRVKVSRLLVWRTGSTGFGGANAAVVGFVPPLRDMLFTDQLLEGMTSAELDAVTAHEAAHLRQHHAIWLSLAVMGAGSASGMGGIWLSEWLELQSSLLGGLIAVGGAVGAVVIVSRRFEWQADAHAARSLVGDGLNGPAIMGDALRRVAMLNGVAMDKLSWRHGSIALRCRLLEGHLEDRVGVQSNADSASAPSESSGSGLGTSAATGSDIGVRNDRVVRWLKIGIVLSLVGSAILALWAWPVGV
jgi:hypothetical protein